MIGITPRSPSDESRLGVAAVPAFRRTGPPRPTHVHGRVFTWTIALSAPPPRVWRQLFVATRNRTLDCDPAKLRFYQSLMIFDSEESLVPAWVRFIDQWMAAANERFARHEHDEALFRATLAEEQRDMRVRLAEAEERFKNL